MNIETVPIADLSPDPANVRKHGEKNLTAIKSSLRRFGQQKPIVIDANGVIRAGNGTYEAAKALGWETLQCVRTGLQGSEATAYAIADNRTGELAEWDLPSLKDQLDALAMEGFDLEELAFNAEDLDTLLPAEPVEIVEDEIPEPPAEPVTQPGDLWILGEHRLLCGDSTKAEDVARLMDGEKADFCLSDPPYNVGFDYGTEAAKDDRNAEDYMAFSFDWFTQAKSVAPVLVFTPGTGRGPQHPNLQMWFKIEFPFWIIAWVKKNAVGHSSLGGFNNWEPLLVYGKPEKKIPQDIYDIPITVQKDVTDDQGRKTHPVPKQVKFFAEVIDDFTHQGSTVYDPFLGSGTTIIAAEQLGRRCFGMEISPQYCDVIVNRWEKLTGKQARRNRHL